VVPEQGRAKMRPRQIRVALFNGAENGLSRRLWKLYF
jgi:hypothetical protein